MDNYQNSHELQIQLDDVTSCTGECPGCALLQVERADSENAGWTGVERSLAFERVKEHIAYLKPKKARLTFGIGDHMLCTDTYLSGLYQDARFVLDEVKGDKSVHITFSFIARPEKLIPRLEHLRESVEKDTPLYPAVIIDPDLLLHSKLGPRFLLSLKRGVEIFSRLDLSVSLSNRSIEAFSPEYLVELALESGANDLALTWTPTQDNAKNTGDTKKLAEWLIAFDKIAKPAGVTASFQPVLEGLLAREYTQDSALENLDSDLISHLHHYLEINHDGELLPRFEAVGDIAQGPHCGFSSLGHISQGSIASITEKARDKLRSRIFSIHAKHSTCQSCPYLNRCLGTGFHIPLTILPTQEGNCPTLARSLFEHFDKTRVLT